MRTVGKDFHTAGCQASVSCTNDLLSAVAPVCRGLVEVSHAIDANLYIYRPSVISASNRPGILHIRVAFLLLQLWSRYQIRPSTGGALTENSPFEKPERSRVKACVVNSSQAARHRVLHGQVEALLELFERRFRTLSVREFLGIVKKDT